jgi:N-acetylglucosamine kinase-like BadF-type ATPase
MRCVLGFDGGGTKTACVLMDETGAVLARTRSGPSNPVLVGVEVAVAALVEASEKALEKTGLEHGDVRSILGGIAGIGVSGAHAQFARQLKPTFPNAVVFLDTDLSMALSATQEIPSAVAIAGTGSAIFGRRTADETAREGGLGAILGDPGSAYDIGRKALVHEWRRYWGREDSHFRNELLEHFRCNWGELQELLHLQPLKVLPQVFPLVIRAANEGDGGAQELLRSSAEELGILAQRVIVRLRLGGDVFFFAKTGGVFGRSGHFDDAFARSVRLAAPLARIDGLPQPVAEFAARCAVNCLDSPVRRVGS